jgi:hypothetical protein
MRNRAKCRLCGDILESFHEFDRVDCKCDEIGISGGNIRPDVFYKNKENFIRVYDNEEVPIIEIKKGDPMPEKRSEPPQKSDEEIIGGMSNEDLLFSLERQIEYAKNEQPTENVMVFQFWMTVNLIYQILKAK